MAVKFYQKVEILFMAMLFLVGATGLLYHVSTALAIAGYYGKMWGFLAFFVPAGAEIFFSVVQLLDGRYNYPILLAAYLLVASAQILFWWGKKTLHRRFVQNLQGV